MAIFDGMAYLRHCAYYLDSNILPCPYIKSLDYFAKGALAEQRHQVIALTQPAVLLDDVVAVFVVDLVAWLMTLDTKN